MATVDELIVTLENSIREVERGNKNEDACCTLVAPTMEGTGIRPKLVASNGHERIYLLNVKQARKLLATCEEARDA